MGNRHAKKTVVLSILFFSLVGLVVSEQNVVALPPISGPEVHSYSVSGEVEQNTPLNILQEKMRAAPFTGHGAYFSASSQRIFSALGVSPYGGVDSSLWDFGLCSEIGAADCSPSDGKWLTAWSILGTCRSEEDWGCIEEVKISAEGLDLQNLAKVETIGDVTVFSGNADLGIPRASSPTKWQASDGSQYVVTSSVTRTFMSGNNIWKSVGTDFQLQIERVSSSATLVADIPYVCPNVSRPDKNSICGGGVSFRPLMFLPSTTFAVKVRLPNVVKGWFQARFKEGEIGSQALGNNNTLYDIAGSVAPIYIAGGVVDPAVLPSDFFQKLYPGISYLPGGVIGPILPGQGTRSMQEYKEWSSYFDDKALMTSYQWNIRSTDWPVNNTCFSSLTGVTGLLATNAAAYLGLPPTWNPESGELEYKVASPHFDETGQVSSGTYSVSMPASAAKCLYGSATLPSTVDVSVKPEEGGTSFNSTLALAEVNGWLNFSVKGFHFSSPSIKLKLGRASSSISPPTGVGLVSPPTTSVSAPPALSIPSTVRVVLISKSLTAKSIATYAKLKVSSTSKVTLKVLPGSAKYCKVTGAALKGLKTGSCKVTVTVTPKKGRPTLKTVTLKIAE